MNTLSIIWLIGDLGQTITVNADLVAVHNLKTGLIGLAEVTLHVSLKLRTT